MGKAISRPTFVAALSFALAACVSTQEMQLAPNVVRLDTSAKGALFVGQAGNATLKRAAEETVKNGYEYFRLEQAQMGQGSQLVGTSSFGSASVYGSPYGATAYGSGFSTPVYAPTSEVGVTVVMFHANEAGAKGAFNAAEVLKKYAG
jgi:hypothetical protein